MHDVFRIRISKAEPSREPEQPGRVTIVKIRQGCAVAVGDAHHQPFIRGFVRAQRALFPPSLTDTTRRVDLGWRRWNIRTSGYPVNSAMPV